jgi:hypothetical protein
MQDTNMTLRDIKPLLEIPDISYYIYYGLISLGVAIVFVVLFFAIRIYLQRRRENLAKGYLASLKAIDWSNPKESAYKATHYARLLATDERRVELFEQLNPLLERYKYKKEVDEIDDETIRYYNLFVQVADESV